MCVLCSGEELRGALTRGVWSPAHSVYTTGTRDIAIAEHRQRKDPTVLIAVNMHEGLDLKDGLARFLIIPKVLYTARDSWINERETMDSGYYSRQTAHVWCRRVAVSCVGRRIGRASTSWTAAFWGDEALSYRVSGVLSKGVLR